MNNLIEKKIKGKVKTILETIYKPNDMVAQYTRLLEKFDIRGNIIEEIYNIGDTIKELDIKEVGYRNTFKYNYFESSNIKEKMKFVKQRTFDGGFEMKLNNLSKFDEKGNIIEFESYDLFGELTSKIINRFQYDDEENIIEKESNYTKDKLKRKTINRFQYDNKRNLIKYDSYNSAGQLTNCSSCIYQYNELGNIILHENYNNEGKLYDRTKYDNNKNLIEYENYGSDGRLTGATRCINNYDKQGNLIEKKFLNEKENSLQTVAFLYSGENWVKQITYQPKKNIAGIKINSECIESLIEREFEYYELS